MTHKDVGKVTIIDAQRFEVRTVLDAGLVPNHVNFIDTAAGRFAYVTVGGEDAVKVFTREATPKLVATIPTGALPHGLWPSDDGSRIYVALENGDGLAVIDTATHKEIARIPGGQAPQAVGYLSNAIAEGPGTANLKPLSAALLPVTLQLRPAAAGGGARGFLVVRSLGPVDGLDINLFHLVPNQAYGVYASTTRSGGPGGLRSADDRARPAAARYIVIAAIGGQPLAPVLVGEVR